MAKNTDQSTKTTINKTDQDVRDESTGSPSLDEAKTGGGTPESKASLEQSPDFEPAPKIADAPEDTGPKISVKIAGDGDFMVHDVTTGNSVDPDGKCHDVSPTAFILGKIELKQLEKC